MGKTVSIWSNTKKNGKATLIYNIITKASEICREDAKVLVICLNGIYGTLFDLFGIDYKVELSIDEVIAFNSSSTKLNYEELIAHKNNVYFMGIKTLRNSRIDKEDVINAINSFKEIFDVVIINTVSGVDDPLTQRLIRETDFTVSLLQQDIVYLNKFNPFLDNCLLYIVNKYNEDIHPSTKTIANDYNLKCKIESLPLCSKWQDMKNKGKAAFYVHEETEFNKKIKDISEYLCDEIGIKRDVKEEKKNFFKKMFKKS